MGRLRNLGVDITPLRGSRDLRRLLASRTVTLLGSAATEVALLVQVKDLTGSALAVALLGLAELVPLVVFGLYGGLLADRLDRRAVARTCEAALLAVAALLTVNAALPDPMLWPAYAGAAAIMALVAVQRPSLDAALPRVVKRDQLAAASALSGLGANAGFILGTSLGGLLAAGPGPAFAFGADAATFVVSLLLLVGLAPLPAGEPRGEQPRGVRGLLEGLRYARGRQELLGSYAVDLVAMIAAYPTAMLPFMAVELDAEWALGLMFAALSAGALVASATSGWVGRIHRHGRAIAVSAGVWGLAVGGVGLAPDVAIALALLVVAGAADMLSGVFRQTLWNQTIPDAVRGRLAGVEVVSYGLGPPVGQLRAGVVASVAGPRLALWSGGLLCLAGVAATCALLPRFAAYDAREGAAEA